MSDSISSDQLVIIWTSREREVALNMVFMYARNSKLRGWWNEVKLIVWGPSAKLLSADEELQDQLEGLKQAGVNLMACKACADIYGVSEKLTELGLDVTYVGAPFTEMLKSRWTCITF